MFITSYIVLLIACIVLGAHALIKYQARASLPHLIAISSGFITAIVTLEFLPFLFESKEQSIVQSIFLFLGLLCFFVFDKFITPQLTFFNSEPSCQNTGCNTHDPKAILTRKSSCQSISCLLVCSFFDGMQLGSAHLISDHMQWVLAIALFFHIAPSGALAASLSLSGNLGDKFALKSSLFIVTALAIGFVISFFIGTQQNSMSYLIPFICGIIIYNIFVHLLPSVVKQKSTILTFIISVAFIYFFLHQQH